MKTKFLLGLSIGICVMSVQAQNPIIQTHYTADPAPMVYNDTLYLYVGCDEKDAPENSYLMREYRLYTTTDMVNWTDHVHHSRPVFLHGLQVMPVRHNAYRETGNSIGIFLPKTGRIPVLLSEWL